jgi:hypothetical protein
MQRTAGLMLTTARAFLDSLAPAQRERALYPFDSEERFNWAFFPMQRNGLAFRDLLPYQSVLGHALISAGYSPTGAAKARMIMSLDEILFENELDMARGLVETLPDRAKMFFASMGAEQLWRNTRDPLNYYLTIFGTPAPDDTWGWRVDGHHVCLNAVVVDGREVRLAPTFFGANPARILTGPRAGLRVLAAEEDLARDLVQSLDAGQRARAVIEPEAPRDILSYNYRRAESLGSAGITADALAPDQRDRLMALLDEYAAGMPEEVAAARRAQVTNTSHADLVFAWAGGLDRGQKHYYRIQTPSFLIEYDNTQNEGNHIHTVWRDFQGDYGLDVLGEHLSRAHAAPAAV